MAIEVKHLEKIARMILVNVPQVQIASACGVSESRISQLMAVPEYKEIEQKVAVEKFQESELINSGWDAVEALGIKATVIALKNNPEPDFALRASAVANKAVRRGSFNNSPINPQSTGVRAVINLNPVFVDKLQQNFNISETKINNLTEKPKDSDFMPAQDVHDLLGSGTEKNKLAYNVEAAITSPEIDELNSLPNLEEFELDS